MNKKKVFTSIFHSSAYYIWMLFLCACIVALYDIRTALIICAVDVLCLTTVVINGATRRKGIKSFLDSLTNSKRKVMSSILGGRLIPMVLIRHDGIIMWSNDGFAEICGNVVVRKSHIKEVISEFDLYDCINTPEKDFYKISHDGKQFLIDISSSHTDAGSENYYAIYFKDCTEYEILKEKYVSEKFVSAVIVVDNYDDVMIDVSNSDKPKVSAAIEETLNLYAQSVNGIIKKYEKDKFMFYFSNNGLNTFIKQRFDILEKVKDISVGNRLSPTLSIGVGYDGENMLQNESYAYKALDMALGRGGDQAIVKNDEKYQFFGGKTQETEKRTKVKARVVAEAIKQLLIENEEILIMGHRYADCDSFGAAIGLYRAVKSLGKSCKIVMETYNNTVFKMLDSFRDIEYEDLIINKAYANEIISRRTLVFVVDTHVKSMLEEPSLLDVSKKIVVIDHHRRNADFIENPLISYHEPYASSASELVTEIIQYMGDQVKLPKKESEALYAGIYMDTKNFTFKTGVRTFEAASYLKRLGVDTISIKRLFQIDINTFMKKWTIMENAITYRHSISIAKCVKNDVDMQTVIAQAADELLNISDINCSFVLCDMGGNVIISARSLGVYNIQVIMEKLGGGGHMTMAATQLPGVDLDSAEEMLKNAIDEYFEENNI